MFCQILRPRNRSEEAKQLHESSLFGVSCKRVSLLFVVQTEQERSSGFGRAARCHERGIAHEG